MHPEGRHGHAIPLSTPSGVHRHGVPTYFQGMPAVPKMVVDRCQPLWVLKYVLKQPIAAPGGPERRGGFLSCAGMNSMQAFDGSKKVMRALWYTLDVTPAGEVLCPGVDAKGQIGEQAGARVAAEQLGRDLGRERPPRERKGHCDNRSEDLRQLWFATRRSCRGRGAHRYCPAAAPRESAVPTGSGPARTQTA